MEVLPKRVITLSLRLRLIVSITVNQVANISLRYGRFVRSPKPNWSRAICMTLSRLFSPIGIWKDRARNSAAECIVALSDLFRTESPSVSKGQLKH